MDFITQLSNLFNGHANGDNASAMRSYMRNKFEFFGIKAGPRRKLFKIALNDCKEEVSQNPRELTEKLYQLPQREFHMCAMEIIEKELRRSYVKNDIVFIEKLLTTNSWWDSVDFIAKNILGKYLQLFPDQINNTIERFSKSSNLWLNRSSIIYQLGYKKKTDESILFNQCERFKHSDEFFIQKAIGWSLREYAKTNPSAIINFVKLTNLKPLSRKEAIRNIVLNEAH